MLIFGLLIGQIMSDMFLAGLSQKVKDFITE